MAEPGVHYVCDLTLVLRLRLVCGLYSARAVPPRWRRPAQLYCLAVATTLFFFLYKITLKAETSAIFSIALLSEYILGFFISLCTGDEYVHTFFVQNALTDITLDSRRVFGQFQKQIRLACIFAIVYIVAVLGLNVIVWHDTVYLVLIKFVLPMVFVDWCGIFLSAPKLLVMGLLNARMLVLKRRLQRYGFRVVGRAAPQPYCLVHDEILRALGVTDNPLKSVLFLDLIFGCCKIISHITLSLFFMDWQVYGDPKSVAKTLVSILISTKMLLVLFGHVALLESANTHCMDMAVFTTTQLIKTPSVAEKRRMREFLSALERRGARYHVLRALPLDARLVVRVLGFCSAQVIVFLNMIKAEG